MKSERIDREVRQDGLFEDELVNTAWGFDQSWTFE
jgi:hypothetical protein